MMIRMVGGWMLLLVPAHPGSPGQRDVKWLLLLLLYLRSVVLCFCHTVCNSKIALKNKRNLSCTEQCPENIVVNDCHTQWSKLGVCWTQDEFRRLLQALQEHVRLSPSQHVHLWFSEALVWWWVQWWLGEATSCRWLLQQSWYVLQQPTGNVIHQLQAMLLHCA